MKLGLRSKVSSVLIALRPNGSSVYYSTVLNLISWLDRRNIKCSLYHSEQCPVPESLTSINLPVITKDQLGESANVDLIISMGGDGTLIGLIRVLKSDIPIFSVNLGKLGFITQFEVGTLYDDLVKVLKNSYETTSIGFGSVEIGTQSKSESFKFINDVVVSKPEIARIMHLRLKCNDEYISSINGDGLIISTPLGSTAYSLAAGGPIVHPGVDSLIITPICPHGLNYRPMVIPGNSKLEIDLSHVNGDVVVTIDGQEIRYVNQKSSIRVSHGKSKKIRLISNTNRSYYQTLKEKFIHRK